MLESTLALILQLLDLKAGWIFLVDDQGSFALEAAIGLPPALGAGEQAGLRWTPCRCQQMLLRGELTGPANVLDCERLQRIHEELAGAGPQVVNAQTGDLYVHVTVPLRAGGRTLGLLNLARAGKEPLDADTLTHLGLVADTLGVAIERARLYAQVDAAWREEVEACNRLAQTLLGLSDLEAIGEAVFSMLRPYLKPDALSLLVADPSGTFLELVAGWGWSAEYVGRLQLPLHPPDSSGPARALHVRRPVLEDHTQPSEAFTVPEPVRRAGVKMCLILPMVAGDTVTGVLVADYLAPREIGEERIRFASLIAAVAAVAVERAAEHRRNRMLFEQVPVALYRSMPNGRLLDVNSAMVRMLGYPDRDALLAVNAVNLYANPEDRARWQRLMEQEGVVTGFEVQWRRFDGTVIWVRESARAVRDATGRPAYYEGSTEDITARKRVEADLQYLASHDPLTGALNRHRFQEELQRLIVQARRTGQSGALLFVDLDNFKEVNDRLGHKAGDDLLRAAVRAMCARLRDTDVLARLGGDEFGILAVPADGGQAVAIAERLLGALREKVVIIGGSPFRLMASCGVALLPLHGVTVDELLAAANLSMYAAKEQGGDRVVLYTPDPSWRDRLNVLTGWTERLRRALDEGRLLAYVQPILDLRENRITRWEFLARLAEEGKVIAPAAFLSAAERLGMVQEIDMWMCRQALRFAARHGQHVHVNFSPKTLSDERAMANIAAELDAWRGAASLLVVEITETAIVADMAQLLQCLEALRSRACQVALDDFGVGFSSLYYLRHLPVDYLKIDAAFIYRLVTDPQDRQIVRTIADLARGLGRATIAEGVEDGATLEAVRALGVDYAQGHHVGRPEPSTAVPES
jgi:diguanylate cyclase (GGDEF)-like protein/PAS domain S-box-containing protein